MSSKKVPIYTIEEIVPAQQMGAEKLEKYLSGIWAKVQENGKLVMLTRSSVQKLMAQQLVSLNGRVIKEKTAKVQAKDVIQLKLFSIDNFKVQESEEQRVSKQQMKQQPRQAQAMTQAQRQQQSQNSQQQSQLQNSQHQHLGDELVATEMKLDVLFEDEWLAVINKPAGLIVHPTPAGLNSINDDNQTNTLVNGLLHRYGRDGLSWVGGADRPGIVHRLDKDTAGILIIAKDDKTHNLLKEMLQEHTEDSITGGDDKGMGKLSATPSRIQKRYCCVVAGRPKKARGLIAWKIARHPQDKNKMVIDQEKGKASLTEYKVIKEWKNIELEVGTKKVSASGSNKVDEYDSIISNMSSSSKNKSKASKNAPKSRFNALSIDSDEEDSEEDKEDSEGEDSDEHEDSDADSEDEVVQEQAKAEEEEEEHVTYKKKKIGSGVYSLLDITLHTGRTHQIRIHTMAEMVPIVGDPIYSGKSKQYNLPYLLLASVYLTFEHPISKKKMEFTIPYPQHIQQFIDQLDLEAQRMNNDVSSTSSSTSESTTTSTTTSTTSSTTSSMKKKKNSQLDDEMLMDSMLMRDNNTKSTSRNKRK
ncbi:hypothetical protein SAMD00019534_103190 [Acytostelium subglobosum LB1]|uniref:hypothetical protein n=1 Tax=Acytostelium subglobosum LB1 TaxID=1410327 RepID=UPI000644B725|nr:hypothetical protein SAMD00019534_103190 [Acytostelium subglobosum LB1]GAM27144.1 hypothetical protein SAMD00019534_103190 [Acytostelium subglobosum LB1]|eukprot:XP_012750024.1 hypothetical protein SAMD00019534_103190 [Acytostelium subglobosum LB1]